MTLVEKNHQKNNKQQHFHTFENTQKSQYTFHTCGKTFIESISLLQFTRKTLVFFIFVILVDIFYAAFIQQLKTL